MDPGACTTVICSDGPKIRRAIDVPIPQPKPSFNDWPNDGRSAMTVGAGAGVGVGGDDFTGAGAGREDFTGTGAGARIGELLRALELARPGILVF